MHEMRTGTDAYVYKGHFTTKAPTLKYWQSQVSLTTVCYHAHQLEMGGSGSPVLVQTELLGPAIIALLQHVNKNEIAHTNQNTASLHQHTSSGAMHLDREHT